jgi:hypothetical protein
MFPNVIYARELKQNIRILMEIYNLYLFPKWKWEEIGMYFVTGLPMTKNQKDMI